MKKLNQFLQNDDLEFPDWSQMRSFEGPVDIDAVIALSEKRLPLLNSRPDREKERLKGKSTLPFVF